jgi:hypothetical protein
MTQISASLRQLVKERAGSCCEYCRIGEYNFFKPHEIDHIVAEKHRGPTQAHNLCVCCFDCNRRKGSDICSLDIDTGDLTALFNPRQHVWSEHFRLIREYTEPYTPIGRVTVFLMGLNELERLSHRRLLIDAGLYPCPTP